jgi:uncharacterized protein YjgD (DUF1641 family)
MSSQGKKVMAQPIALKLPPRDPKKELISRLEEAPAEHAAALLDGYELLQKLYEHRVFDLVRGVLGATDKVVEAASEGANSAEAIRAMRNAILLAKLLGSIDPEFLQAVSTAAGETFGDARSVPSKPPGLLSLLSSSTGPDHRRGLALVMGFFKNVGAGLNTQKFPDTNK